MTRTGSHKRSGSPGEASLDEVLAQAHPFLEWCPDAALIVDGQGIIHLANAEAGALFGYSEGELTGEPVEVLLPQRLRDEHLKHRAGYARNPKRIHMGARLNVIGRRKDGGELPLDTS